ncbi:MAG: hypothetical protein D4S02_10060 [Rhodocyclaceae bacterium]|nr:MAG: hypothetical protein D4S02_10060 [Rhodocyclaceae bacterium]
MKIFQVLASTAVAALLLGCASTVQINDKTAKLLPEPAALAVLEKYVGVEWTKSPYIEKWGNCVPKETRVSIIFADIKGLTYNPTLGKLFILQERPVANGFFGASCIQQVGFSMDKDAAVHVSTALRSLGACTHPKSFAC